MSALSSTIRIEYDKVMAAFVLSRLLAGGHLQIQVGGRRRGKDCHTLLFQLGEANTVDAVR
jgi:hypothetical protein